LQIINQDTKVVELVLGIGYRIHAKKHDMRFVDIYSGVCREAKLKSRRQFAAPSKYRPGADLDRLPSRSLQHDPSAPPVVFQEIPGALTLGRKIRHKTCLLMVGLAKASQASQRGLEVVDEFRIWDSLASTSNASRSATPRARVATRCTSDCALQHFCDTLRCLVKLHHVPHTA
jgi:hypothetical protein